MPTSDAPPRFLSLLLVAVLALPVLAADKPTVHVETELYSELADNLRSAFDAVPLPEQGPIQHAVIVDSFNFGALSGAMDSIAAGYKSGLPIVILDPSPEAQSFLDEITGGDVDLPPLTRPKAIGDPVLQAFVLRRAPGAATADTAAFWAEYDAHIGPAAEEKAEDDNVVASIAQWVAETPAPAAAPPPPSAPKGRRPMAMKADKQESNRSIDSLTNAIVRKVSTSFGQASLSTTVRSWAAYSPAQDEDWYIFELTTVSVPLNFRSKSLKVTPKFFGAAEIDERDDDMYCRGELGTGCSRVAYATKVEVAVAPKTPGLELMYWGPDSDRQQDEYTYSSKFSLGGKVTAGYDDKGPKAGVELSSGVEFSRNSKVTIKDATLVGVGNTNTNLAGWRFEMPAMRAVNDLRGTGGPSTSCDNLLQMPYPVQRGSMQSTQFAIYRLPAAQRAGLSGVDLRISFLLEEGTSVLGNPTSCNVFNCNCSPSNATHAKHESKDMLVSFPLAAHKAGS